MEARLKAKIWIQAQLRLLDLHCIHAVISRHGDEDAGAIYIKLIRSRTDVTVYSPRTGPNGERGWGRGTGPEPVAEYQADDYITRQANFDPDIWVLEIEDPKGLYGIDGPVFD